MNTAVKKENEVRVSPLLIPSATFINKLNIDPKNVNHTKVFLDKGVTDYFLPGFRAQQGYRLVSNFKGTEIRLLSLMGSVQTVYFVKLALKKDIVPGRTTVTQSEVWRTSEDEHQDATTGLARAMFDHLLEQYSVIVSDTNQTTDGSRFWQIRLSNYTKSGSHYVYLMDRVDASGEDPAYRITDFKALKDISPDDIDEQFYKVWHELGWGFNKEVHQHRLFIISKEPLEEASLTEMAIADMREAGES